MVNKIKIQTDDVDLMAFYTDKVGVESDDCGFDFYCPEDLVVPKGACSFKVDLQVKTAFYDTNDVNVGYMLTPRSSMGSKTPLRQCNSIGIIDRGYRGSVMAFVDNVGRGEYTIKKGDRLFQAVSFNGEPIKAEVVTKLTTTSRGDKGFGSSGK